MDKSLKSLRTLMHTHKHPWKRHTFGPSSGLLLLKLLVYTNITANQISTFALFYVLIPLFLIVKGTQSSAILGSLLMFFIITLDHADGALARFRNSMSLMGAYLEKMYHRLIPPLLFMAVSIYAYKYFQSEWFVAVGILTMLVMFIAHWSSLSKLEIVMLKSKKKIKKSVISIDKRMDKKALTTKIYHTVMYFLNHIEWLCVITFVLALTNTLQYMILFYFPFYTLIALGKVYLEWRSGFKEFGLPYYREQQ